jgi:hypothetical protein
MMPIQVMVPVVLRAGYDLNTNSPQNNVIPATSLSGTYSGGNVNLSWGSGTPYIPNTSIPSALLTTVSASVPNLSWAS